MGAEDNVKRFHQESLIRKDLKILLFLKSCGIEFLKPLVRRKTAIQIMLVAVEIKGILSILRRNHSSLK